jgi:hypothetical protein
MNDGLAALNKSAKELTRKNLTKLQQQVASWIAALQ